MVEVMSGCLVGAALGVEASSLYEEQGAPPDLGQVIIALDATALSKSAYANRMRDLAEVFLKTDGARFPGLSRLTNRKKAAAEGIVLPAVLDCEIRTLAKRDETRSEATAGHRFENQQGLY